MVASTIYITCIYNKESLLLDLHSAQLYVKEQINEIESGKAARLMLSLLIVTQAVADLPFCRRRVTNFVQENLEESGLVP